MAYGQDICLEAPLVGDTISEINSVVGRNPMVVYKPDMAAQGHYSGATSCG